MYTLNRSFRTKTEAKAALKRGERLQIVSPDGRTLTSANGHSFPICGKLDHYKEWKGTASVWNGMVTVIR